MIVEVAFSALSGHQIPVLPLGKEKKKSEIIFPPPLRLKTADWFKVSYISGISVGVTGLCCATYN